MVQVRYHLLPTYTYRVGMNVLKEIGLIHMSYPSNRHKLELFIDWITIVLVLYSVGFALWLGLEKVMGWLSI